jgi:hypothetical protein
MRRSKYLIAVVCALVVTSISGAVFAGQSDMPFPPPPPTMGLSGICVYGGYLYVMAGGKIMEYNLNDPTKVVSSVDLPMPPLPTSTQVEVAKSGQMPPHPPMGGPHGLWPEDNVLYVLAGPVVYTCNIPGLTTLQAIVELPKPEFPKSGS